MTTPASPLVRLVRLPAVLTVPGDVLLGAAWSEEGEAGGLSVAVLALGSSLLYLGGMALNDWADRARDARERPWRPIPAGEVAPAVALGSAVVLTAGALAAGGLARGGRGLRAAARLAGVVWAYDLVAKDTPAGPWAMALARALDVSMGALPAARPGWRLRLVVPPPALSSRPGAGRWPRGARLPATVVGAHALLLTLVSAREVSGGSPAVARRALGGFVATAATAAGLALGGRPAAGPTHGGHPAAGRRPTAGLTPGSRRAGERALALACLALYGATVGRAGVDAVRRPDPVRLQRLVGAGVLATMPLQAALLAGRGRPAAACAVLAGWPLARWAGRETAVT
jgi:4-hydroxybenzoate polyprenyltransferase